MKMRKEKHLMNNQGETKGYDIIIKVGNKEYRSWNRCMMPVLFF
jgi:fibrillarin-like rRNA methylase